MLNHGMSFNLGSAKGCSLAIFDTYFSCHVNIWIAVTYFYIYILLLYIVLFPLTVILTTSYLFSLLISAVILLLNYLDLILYLCMHFFSLGCYFLNLNIMWTFISLTLL